MRLIQQKELAHSFNKSTDEYFKDKDFDFDILIGAIHIFEYSVRRTYENKEKIDNEARSRT